MSQDVHYAERGEAGTTFLFTSLIDADSISAQAIYLVSIGRTIAVILVNPLLMASQHFSFADFFISPEFLAASRTTQQEHIKSLPYYDESIPSSAYLPAILFVKCFFQVTGS
jgi:hypothetical protein